jgi:SAM-dependent methyltransferase
MDGSKLLELDLLDLLACPDCRGELEPPKPKSRASELRCVSCERRFPDSSSGPQLFPSETMTGERWTAWREKQELGKEEYENPDVVETEHFDSIAAKFGRFARPHGVILDVGCGIDGVPTYAREAAETNTFIGLDPLDGADGRDFAFVQGIGEQLPFKDAVFEYALSATCLDHAADPKQVLAELRRVLKPDGTLAVWIGVVDDRYFDTMHGQPLSSVLVDPITRARVGELVRKRQFHALAAGAWHVLVEVPFKRVLTRIRRNVDRQRLTAEVFAERMRYHFEFFREPEVIALLQQSGYSVVRKHLIKDAAHGNSLFVLARPVAGAAA